MWSTFRCGLNPELCHCLYLLGEDPCISQLLLMILGTVEVLWSVRLLTLTVLVLELFLSFIKVSF